MLSGMGRKITNKRKIIESDDEEEGSSSKIPKLEQQVRILRYLRVLTIALTFFITTLIILHSHIITLFI